MAVAERKLHETTSLCTVCKQGIHAEVWETDGRIVMRKACPEHRSRDVLVASDAAWYHDVMSYAPELSPPTVVRREVENGCPFDCGFCPSHQQKMYLPVIPITSACNLNCPVCYTINKNEDAYYMSLEEFGEILDVLRTDDPDLKIINFTGGEPTLHPQLLDIIGMCHDAGIHRITMSTHGLTFLQNEALLADLAELRTRIVLSFGSFHNDVNRAMVGGNLTDDKLQVLDLLEKYDVDTTVIPVLALGYNEGELGRLVDMLLDRRCMRSLEIHTMAFTGQGGLDFDASARITSPDVLHSIEESTNGRIRTDDFVPSPCAHPLCYQTCYLLETQEQGFVPFRRFMTRENIRELLTGNLYMEPGERMETVLQDVIMDLWAMEMHEQTGEEVLRSLKRLLLQLFPSTPIDYPEQQRIAERSAKTIYIHSHMDDDSFDSDRIRQCCVGVPATDGGVIPTCSYNILYRGRDPRYFTKALEPISALNGGRKW
jgi:uncharacterized radical SAM superfamily Fe-S cluster-containing enzyme